MRRFHELSAAEYAKLDIGEVNLECADKLPGSENLDVKDHLVALDEWAEAVQSTTAKRWKDFKRQRAKFNSSAPYFRMLVLATVLQRDFGVAYNLDTLKGPFDTTDSRTQFIHGILEGYGGTCSSMPVLYAAIGRRLGYPLKLVQAEDHWFVRWDDPSTGVSFNIEATSPGLNCYPDEHYLTWPKKPDPGHVKKGWLLRSLTPREELAAFYQLRAQCFLDWGNYTYALELAGYASGLVPRSPYHQGFHAIVTVLYQSEKGLAKYGFIEATGEGIVMEDGKTRPMEPWEPWAVRQAEKELKRIIAIRRSRIPHCHDLVFQQPEDFEADPTLTLQHERSFSDV